MKDLMNDYKKIAASVEFMKKWIKTDLKELDGDCISDYAKFILKGHEHIETAISVMEDIVNPTRGIQE